MTRARRTLAALVAAAVLAPLASYARAQWIAEAALGRAATDLGRVREGLVPLRRTPDGAWAWVFGYGPKSVPGHVGFELYVSPVRGRLTANPPDLLARLSGSGGPR